MNDLQVRIKFANRGLTDPHYNAYCLNTISTGLTAYWEHTLVAYCCYTNIIKVLYTVENRIFRVKESNIWISGVHMNFVQWGFQQIQLRTEDRENGDLGAVAPYSGVLRGSGGSCNLVQEI